MFKFVENQNSLILYLTLIYNVIVTVTSFVSREVTLLYWEKRINLFNLLKIIFSQESSKILNANYVAALFTVESQPRGILSNHMTWAVMYKYFNDRWQNTMAAEQCAKNGNSDSRCCDRRFIWFWILVMYSIGAESICIRNSLVLSKTDIERMTASYFSETLATLFLWLKLKINDCVHKPTYNYIYIICFK